MNEEMNTTPQEQTPADAEQSGTLPTSKRNALVRYIAILFVFAFLIVLLSLFLQYRSNASKQISDLTSASNSAMARAEQLQSENMDLHTTVNQMKADAATTQEAHEQELVEQQEVYDALMRILNKEKKSSDSKFAEDVKRVTEGKDMLSQTAWEAFTDYAEEAGIEIEIEEEAAEEVAETEEKNND